ncbi:hypothetical protein LEP1GSC132_0983 [Leptospira kirschneri str. 200803703]|uniref:Uncharacterized protein n=1 Tax=Leptospira kirschneri serovar Pomona TaxID=561005 RepID=A0A1T1DGI4_9LEPT|nr:hypothetical protein LEP1GSC132_0983 [Leptospira kirschneri str. 200803703]OOV39937.1 hypothetical protein B1J93_20385 [Leptospira kirschneri serovar Pomona]
MSKKSISTIHKTVLSIRFNEKTKENSLFNNFIIDYVSFLISKKLRQIEFVTFRFLKKKNFQFS